MKMTRVPHVIWCILLTSIFCWSGAYGLYFPISEVQLLLPAQLPADTMLFRAQALMDNGTEPEPSTVTYSLSVSSPLVTLSSSTGELRLKDITSQKEGSFQTTIMATGPKKEITNMTISIMPLKSDGKTLDCDAMFKDICFWSSVKYQILENQPPSLLGTLGPEYMSTLCPQHNLSYTLNPGSKFFGLERTSKQWMLRTHQSLDRESGDMSQNHPTVVCSVTRTGFQQDVNMTLNVMVLDEDDSPPVLMSANVTDIYLNNTQLKKGDVLEKDSLIIADQDSSEVNRFYIDVLQDDQKFFRPNCREEKVMTQDTDHSLVYCTLGILKALELPKDIYTVVLHVNDSSLTTNATNYVDAILNFHKGMKPMDDPLYPEQVNILRGAMLFTRVTQPHQMMEEQSSKFWLANSSWVPPGGVAPFNVTGEGGIIYVSDSLALQSAPDIVQLTIAWDSPGSAMLSVKITNGTSEVCNGTKNSGSAPMMCSSQKSWEMCTMLCGLGTGGNDTTHNGIKDKMEFMSKGGCAWRGQKNVSDEMTMEYATCTPDISTCPDGMCDPLEQMNPALCPQDCIPTDKLSGTGMMKGSNSSQGIMSAAGVCTCEPSGMCKCEKLTDMSNLSTTEMVTVSNPSVAPFSQEECPEEGEEGSRCGSLCQLAIIIACLLLLAFVIAFLLWRFKWSQGAMVCPTPPCSCSRESCSTCMNCSSGAKCSTCPRCPSCPYCSACPACFSCSPPVCKGGSLCNWLPQKFQRTEPAPTVSATPSSRVSTEFVQSVDAHLLPYNYMGPLGNMNPGHK